MSNIALVGLGNLGLRHLQGLAKCTTPLAISLIDPSRAAIERARAQWEKEVGPETVHDISEVVPTDCAAAIIATTANYRHAAVAALSARTAVKAWLLEKPLAQSIADIGAIEAVAGDRAWVNTPRRVIAWHREMASAITAAGGPWAVAVAGGRWGLACNALHFIDLLRWWSGSEPVQVDVSGLDSSWHESKRPGFADVYGTLRITFADSSSLALSSDASDRPHVIEVRNAAGLWRIEERDGRFHWPDGRITTGQMTYQSALTGPLVDAMLAGHSPGLPGLRGIAEVERLLLRALLPHYHAAGGSPDRLNIT